ncbi:penicillin-binding protein 1C [Microvirga thermotolerans]|uniref:peptidoglycan glycosyltransferase n=1 Tax=Microvirga thermotolerans TaxID=2651334 RepID=A0A5P9K2Y8_9HYPH|nr:penicillin-binding protein 1C [Microvirga thermotolerans]QFU18025.1 penicillin-binding protein 1C [Microvirga thermotolerans]
MRREGTSLVRAGRRIAAGLAGLVALAGLGLWSYVESLGPLDLSVSETRSTVVLDREGRLLRPFVTAEGRWRLPLATADVDPHYLAMLKAYEDARFDRHAGVDPFAMLRAFHQLVRSGGVVSGGSTLTMQVARLLEPREDRTIGAKLRQVVRALQLERRLTKDQILTLYLTLAPYGGNLEGARAASLSYFGREPKRLSFAEAALLVALPQAPELRRPDRDPQAARRARDRVIDRVRARGVIGAAEAEAAKAEPVPNRRYAFPMLAAHAAEQAVAERPSEKVQRLAIDARLQANLERLARERIERLDPRLSLAILVIHNATGEVRAQVGSPDYLSRERAGAIDMTQALRSPGSALKPIVYALAFENGLAHPETLLDDRPSRYGAYQPENFDLGFQGTVTARRALQLSLNVPAVELLNELGPARLLARLHQTGIGIAMPREAAPGLAIGLGGLGITLTDLTRIFAGLARGGEVPRLARRFGEVPPPDAPRRIADPVSAWYVFDILRGAPPPDNALAGRIAFKTGTSYGYRDAWAVGYDRNYTVGVWIGRPDGTAVPGLVGRASAAPVLFDAYGRLGVEPEALPVPPFALQATTATLPPPLRHVRQDVPKTLASTVQAPLRITFPLDGSRVELGLSGGEEGGSLALKASGGVPPLTWLVDGAPVEAGSLRRSALWQPQGVGFVRLSVIDAKGATDSVVVRVE